MLACFFTPKRRRLDRLLRRSRDASACVQRVDVQGQTLLHKVRRGADRGEWTRSE